MVEKYSVKTPYFFRAGTIVPSLRGTYRHCERNEVERGNPMNLARPHWMRLPQRLERFCQLIIPANRFAMTNGCHCEEAQSGNPMNLAHPSFDEIAAAVRTFPSFDNSRKPLRNDSKNKPLRNDPTIKMDS